MFNSLQGSLQSEEVLRTYLIWLYKGGRLQASHVLYETPDSRHAGAATNQQHLTDRRPLLGPQVGLWWRRLLVAFEVLLHLSLLVIACSSQIYTSLHASCHWLFFIACCASCQPVVCPISNSCPQNQEKCSLYPFVLSQECHCIQNAVISSRMHGLHIKNVLI